jgi:hypothetical protein
MITPHKYMDIEKNVINFSAICIKYFKKNKVVEYNKLYKIFQREEAENLFIETVDLLFLLGIVNYNKVGDVFIYEGKK